MDLNEKIQYCRKREGMSQEELAARIGVSRQAISKWENKTTEPEIGKLRLLAKEFNVTYDWLLSEDSDDEEGETYGQNTSPGGSWVDSLPGALGRLLKRYGWVFGVYLAVSGAGIAMIGIISRLVAKRMMSFFKDDPFGGMASGLPDLALNNPVSIFGSVLIVFGSIIMVFGIVLAVILKMNNRENTDG